MSKSGVPSAFSNDSTNLFYAIELALDTGVVRLWTGYGNITIEGETFYGLGKCLSVSPIEETGQMAVTSITVAVSGITSSESGDSDLITDALSEPLQGRPLTCYLGTLDASRVSDHYIIFKGNINTLKVSDSAGTSQVAVQADSRLVEFNKPKVLRYTDFEQRWLSPQGYSESGTSQLPDDTLDGVAKLQNKKIDWSTP